ncbi:MAG: hypothetical protein ACXVCP_08505 [Bdellovibrio sp.]
MQRIQLTDRATKVTEKLVAEFKKRKIPQQDWPKIFSEAIIATSQDFWNAQIEKLTPDSYFLDQALQDPKMQKEFLEFVKSKKVGSNNPEARDVDSTL